VERAVANRVFVGNIPFDVTEAELREFFKLAGKITQIAIPKDRETGKSRGFAFLEFESHSQMMDAIERYKNAILKDRKISVSEAKKKDSSQSKTNLKVSTSKTNEPSVIWEEEEVDTSREKKQRKEVDFEASSKAKKKILAEMEEKNSKNIIRQKSGKFIGSDDEEDEDDDFIPVYMKEPEEKEE
jgi:RNA recognition motif-containing protein